MEVTAVQARFAHETSWPAGWRAALCQVVQGASSGMCGAYRIQGCLSAGCLQDSHLDGRQGRLEAEYVIFSCFLEVCCIR